MALNNEKVNKILNDLIANNEYLEHYNIKDNWGLINYCIGRYGYADENTVQVINEYVETEQVKVELNKGE